LVSDVVGYSRLAGADEARLRALRSDLIDPTISLHHGRIVKRTGDGSIIEFNSVVDAVRCAIEVRLFGNARNSGLSEDRVRIGLVRMGAVWAARDFKAVAGATDGCREGSNFLFADHHDAGEIESPDRGDGLNPYWPKAVYPLPPGAIRIRSRRR
jgi:hypothetical protein